MIEKKSLPFTAQIKGTKVKASALILATQFDGNSGLE